MDLGDLPINADHLLRIKVKPYRKLRNSQLMRSAEQRSLREQGRPLGDQERQDIQRDIESWPNNVPT